MHNSNKRWAPFNSVMDSSKEVTSILYERKKIQKPNLTDEQYEVLENKILNYYYSKELISISFFKNFYIHKIDGLITKLDPFHKIIVINSKFKLYFYNIIDINEKKTCI